MTVIKAQLLARLKSRPSETSSGEPMSAIIPGANAMSDHTQSAVHAHAAPTGFIRKYVFSLDHKVIGLQYYFLALVAVFVGVFLSLLMRLHLVWPNADLPFFGHIAPEQYLTLLTMHGTIMVFFVLTTAPQSGFGNYFLPIQIGAPDMAFPTLNMLSFWVTFLAFAVLIAAFFVAGGAPLSGWTNYPPLSAIPSAGPGQGLGEDLWVISIALFCVAALMGALNFITTTLDLRARGMSLFRMPLTTWAWFVTAMLGLLAFGVLLAGGILLLLDRNLGTSFFVPGGLNISGNLSVPPGGLNAGGSSITHNGGSPLLWQHLFWFFGHPEVYIAILPAMGITSQLLSTFSRKPIFGYKAMVYAILAIGILGFLVWGHHMFMSGMSPYSAFAFSVMTMAIGVPSAIKTFNWLGTIWGGRVRFTTPMLFAIGFVSLFVSGGLSGPFLAQPVLDIPLHDTYFVVGHFHLIMGVAAIFGIFAGTYYWFPKMFGRMMNETLGRIHFFVTLAGTYAIFMPMHYLGMAGHPRRYSQLTELQFLQPLLPLQRFMTIAAFITIGVQLVFVFNLFWSMKKGKKAGMNPWEATTLEWTVPSPPPHDNFGGGTPVVYRGAYEYSVPGAPKDYLMQNDPATVVAH
jgi:cytochrome c oxidase subunit 1